MKTKNIVLYIIVCVIIFASFKIPDILLNALSNNIEKSVYKKEKVETTLDIEAEKIYLVKAIRDIETENMKVEISSSDKSWVLVEAQSEEESKIQSFPTGVEKQLLKLKDYNILQNFNIDENVEYNVSLISKSYQGENSYTINNVFFSTPNQLYNIEMEEKTGKILFINFAKDNLFAESTKKDILINYVKYLDLNIIDDWCYENEMLKSNKAGLAVSLSENDTRYILTINSIEKNSSNVIYTYKD